MKVEIQLEKTAKPIAYETAINTYEKGSFYCVMFEKDGKRVTHKFPTERIFRVVEDYNDTKR